MTETLPIPLTAPLTQAQIATLTNLVRRAARAEIMPRFRKLDQSAIATKSGPEDLVTEADHAAEAMIARGLQQMFPHALVVGEEAASADPFLRDRISEAELAFILDPVDGTWNFVHGLAMFGVIVAVTRFGVPVHGLLYDPVMDDVVSAAQDAPARLTSPTAAPRALKVAAPKPLSEMSGFMHYYLMDGDTRAALAPHLADFTHLSTLRCSCHEYRTIAQGGADFLLSGVLNPWDHAAGILCVQRAGGVVRMLDGRNYTTAIKDGYILAATSEDSWQALAHRFSVLNRQENL